MQPYRHNFTPMHFKVNTDNAGRNESGENGNGRITVLFFQSLFVLEGRERNVPKFEKLWLFQKQNHPVLGEIKVKTLQEERHAVLTNRFLPRDRFSSNNRLLATSGTHGCRNASLYSRSISHRVVPIVGRWLRQR